MRNAVLIVSVILCFVFTGSVSIYRSVVHWNNPDIDGAVSVVLIIASIVTTLGGPILYLYWKTTRKGGV